MVTQPAEKKKKERNAMGDRGPNPAHILLDAISGAMRGNVDPEQILLLIDMARQAYGTDQSTSWKMVAKTLREKTEETHALDVHGVSDALTAATSTIPDSSPDAG